MSTQLKGKAQIINNDNLEQHVVSTNKKTTRELEPGVNATTLKPGLMYPIMFKDILAGEYIESWSINNLTRLLTPLSPSFDRSYITIMAYFVPHTRIWKRAEKALAGTNTGLTNIIQYTPKLIIKGNDTNWSPYNRTILSKYGLPNNASDTEINPFLLRGYRAISNDFWRNKDWAGPKIEWNSDEVTEVEENNIIVYDNANNPLNYLPNVDNSTAYLLEAAPGRKGYLTNIKRQISIPQENIAFGDGEIYNHLDWQTQFNDMKQRQDNVNKNTWDIIAEMGGTQPVVTDRVQYLGKVDYEMNFQQITQSAPEIDNSSPLGTTGAFSYTRASGTLFNHKKFLQSGQIHIIMCITIDNYFENGTPKELLKTNINDMYRPGLAKKEIQLLMKQEISNTSGISGSAAYQPAWAEYKRLPSFASGQMQSSPLEHVAGDIDYAAVSNSHWHNMKPRKNEVVIDENYFRPYKDINKVFARNNILMLNENGIFDVDPFLNMSEHRVKTALPIEKAAITQVTKAETKI